MEGLKRDMEILKAGLAEGRDVSELKFETGEFSGLALDLAKRYSRLDTQARRRIRTASASLNRAKLEKEQYKSSLSELQKILDLCRVISSSLDLKDILHHLLFLLSEILPSRGCAVFVGGNRGGSPEKSIGTSPLLASNFTPQLQQILAQHHEEGIIRWILNERRVCLIPSFEDRSSDGGANGDFAVIPLNDNDANYGFIWIACTITQEDVTPETTNLIWVLSSHASIAIMNCLHRQRMEEQINELKLLTSINALKGETLRRRVPREEDRDSQGGIGASGSLHAFFREFQRLVAKELKLGEGYLITGGPEPTDLSIHPPLGPIDSAPFLEHAEIRRLLRSADKEHVRLEAGDFFQSAYPHVADALGSAGLALLAFSPGEEFGGEKRAAYLLLPLTTEDMQRIPLLQNLLQAVASQARVVAENIDLYDSLLAANRNLTALQWQLVHSGKMAALGQLAGGVAHEINNPLQIMLGRIQMIQMMAEDKKPAGKAKLKDELNLVTEEVLRIRDIVRNLLDFSRQGKRETSLSPMSMNDTVKDVLALLQHQLISNQVDVRLALEPGNTRVLGNRNQLKQVFINLMMNAIHAMEQEPRVLEIATVVRDGMVMASVRDSGVGIAQENISRIFEPFFSTKSMGTGLGLSISYGLIKEHRGTIEVESQESRGTCFTVRLPKIAEEALGYNLLVG
ncbi:MAG: sensor histidine kinase [Fibrobacteres bacterium]|nr:sensor histidine kinase [Fibrobacterota bacterium]